MTSTEEFVRSSLGCSCDTCQCVEFPPRIAIERCLARRRSDHCWCRSENRRRGERIRFDSVVRRVHEWRHWSRPRHCYSHWSNQKWEKSWSMSRDAIDHWHWCTRSLRSCRWYWCDVFCLKGQKRCDWRKEREMGLNSPLPAVPQMICICGGINWVFPIKSFKCLWVAVAFRCLAVITNGRNPLR